MGKIREGVLKDSVQSARKALLLGKVRYPTIAND